MKKIFTFWSDMRSMGPKQAAAHIWYYYHWQIISLIFVVLFLVAIIPEKEIRQSVGICMIEDTLYEEGELLSQTALSEYTLSPEEYYIELYTLFAKNDTIDPATQLSINIASDTVDAVICTRPVLEQLLELDVFIPAAEEGILEITPWFSTDLPVYLCLIQKDTVPQGILALQEYACSHKE